MLKLARKIAQNVVMVYQPKTYESALKQLNTAINKVTIVRPVNLIELHAKRCKSIRSSLLALGIKDSDINDLHIIHVTGSKGKGSTCATVEAVLRNLGYRTGMLSSPHLINVEERIRINGRPISQDYFAQLFWDVHSSINKLDDSSLHTFLHYILVMACKAFVAEKVDAAIFEVGIGGRYDHTNFFEKPALSVVTHLDLEHTDMLGNTLEKIAWMKAGIFKSGSPALVSADQTEGTLHVFIEQACAIGCPLYITPRLEELSFAGNLFPNCTGNASSGIHKVRSTQLCQSLSTVHLWLKRYNGQESDSTGK
ncbi:Folylpolyglutamate synthase [Paragonimus heterotremus]|uniref:Folylpolyglutamate synthase n=1 Tax=Paragonimus heterotremus TaxID=100268 RepID=A0A8J4T5D6_9TREM|nr:Folylpolyglutamate synthase [Paragonimus heterotremus]